MDQISYVAKWTAFGRAIFVEQANLSHPLVLGETEPACGFGLRRQDSGDAIARALLLHATGDAALAASLGARFATAVIADLPPAGFRLTRSTVLDWVASVPAKSPPRRLRLIKGGGPDPDRPSPRRGSPTPRRSVAGPSRRAA